MDGLGKLMAAATASGIPLPDGIDPATMGTKASQIWTMLDNMAKNDPRGYQRFIKQQEEMERRSRDAHLLPRPGFAYHTNDREAGETVYVNCCHHRAVQPPQKEGKPVVDDKGKALVSLPKNLAGCGLMIPLIVGPARVLDVDAAGVGGDAAKEDAHKLTWVIDVIMNPWVAAQAALDTSEGTGFKMSLCELSMQWIEEDHGMTLSRAYKLETDKTYVGGTTGPDGITECAPYWVSDDEIGDGKPSEKPPPSRPNGDTRREERAKLRAEHEEEVKARGGGGKGGDKGAGGAGAGAGGGGVTVTEGADGVTMLGAASPAVGGGQVGRGGHGPSGPGSAMGVGQAMSSPGALLSSMRSGGAGADGGDGGAGAAPAEGGALAALLGAGAAAGAGGAGVAPPPVPLSAASQRAMAKARAAREASGGGKGKGKGKGKGGDSAAAASTAAPKKPLIEEVLPAPEYTITDDAASGSLVIVVKLPGVTSIGGVDLDLSATQLKLSAPGAFELDARLPQSVVQESAKAKFSKKRQALTITVPVVTDLESND